MNKTNANQKTPINFPIWKINTLHNGKLRLYYFPDWKLKGKYYEQK